MLDDGGLCEIGVWAGFGGVVEGIYGVRFYRAEIFNHLGTLELKWRCEIGKEMDRHTDGDVNNVFC